MLEIMTNDAESSAKIIVVGVGGAGNNAVNRMIDEILAVLSLSVLTQMDRHCSYVKHQQQSRLARSLQKDLVQVHSLRLDRRQQKRI